MKGTQIMQHVIIVIASVCVSLSLTVLAGCATYKTTLTDAQGRTVTCEASGKSGIITGYYLRRGFEDCIAAAKTQGFNQGQNGKMEDSQETIELSGSKEKDERQPAANPDTR